MFLLYCVCYFLFAFHSYSLRLITLSFCLNHNLERALHHHLFCLYFHFTVYVPCFGLPHDSRFFSAASSHPSTLSAFLLCGGVFFFFSFPTFGFVSLIFLWDSSVVNHEVSARFASIVLDISALARLW